MRFLSTEKKSSHVSFEEALKNGFAPDGGLYLPTHFPKLSLPTKGMSFPQCALHLSLSLFPDLPKRSLEEAIYRAFSFPLVAKQLDEKSSYLELFHGPTGSFKDVGARFMKALLELFFPEKPFHILVATTGDTGSACASAFEALPHSKTWILFPKNRVTKRQKEQLTRFGDNVEAIEIDAPFETCQAFVKKACLDPTLQNVTTGNSINIARLFAQMFYYFYAYQVFDERSTFSVPSGNFGHVVSGLFAKEMGLPIQKIYAPTNRNDEVPLYLKTGEFIPHLAYPTCAPSMDVGNPSNFPRLLELFQSDLSLMRNTLESTSFTDDEIKKGIKQVYQKWGIVFDPHTITGFLGLKGRKGTFFATAHPSKFPEALGDIPCEALPLSKAPSRWIEMSDSYASFQELLRV